MILFTILSLIIVMLLAIIVFAISIGGTVFVIIFGDVIVCVAILIWAVKKKFF